MSRQHGDSENIILMHPWRLELGRLYVGGWLAGKSTNLKLVVMLVLLGE